MEKISVLLCCMFLCTSCANDSISTYKPNDFGNTFDNLNNLGLITQDEKNIYYFKIDLDNPGLYKCSMKDKNELMISNEIGYYLNIVDNNLYFISDEDNYIYTIDITGNNKSRISSVKSCELFAAYGYLFAIDKFNNNLYRMSMDGTDITLLIDDLITSIYIYETDIYCMAVHDDKTVIYRLAKDGHPDILIEDSNILWFSIYNNKIYYTKSSNELYEFNIGTGEINKLLDIIYRNGCINMNNGFLYFGTTDGIYQMDLQRQNLKKLSTQKVDTLYLINNRIYYLEGDYIFHLQ